MTASSRQTESSAAAQTFERVIAGVDVRDPRLDAVRQAALLVSPAGWLELYCAVYLVEANLAGWSATRIRQELEREAGEALVRAQEIAGARAVARLVNGPPVRSLVRELVERDATLAVVGTRGDSRWSEILIGGGPGEVLHEAPCSVCIARPLSTGSLPRSVVVGVDGSPESARAVAVARHVADRHGTSLAIVAATGGKHVDRGAAEEMGAAVVDGHRVAALVAACRRADLLVVGSRGLHGLRALGSVSERVAQRAPCSVLVVRGSD